MTEMKKELKQQHIRLIVTSDTHGHWLNQPENPEVSLLNTVSCIKSLQAKPADVTLTIDLGDFIQGSSWATYLSQERQDGTVFARAMNAIGYDYQLIGNHEFNFGQAYRDTILDQLDSQILLANIVEEETQQPFIGKPYEIIEKDGFSIGIIGLTTSYIPHWELPANYQGLAFLDVFETAKRYVEEVRPLVDILVVAYHGGFERDLRTGVPTEELTKENQGYQMLEGIEGIDVLLTGHQHREILESVGSTYVVQPGSMGQFVAEVEIELEDKLTGNTEDAIHYTGHLHGVAGYPKDDALKDVLEPELSEGQAWLNTILGEAPLAQTATTPLQARVDGHPFIELLNQIQFDETGADFSSVALVNDAFLNFHGPITNEVLLKSYPFYNLIAKTKVSGQELYEILEFDLAYFSLTEQGRLGVNREYFYPKPKHYNYDLYSGMITVVDIRQAVGQRVKQIIDKRTGEPIDRQRSYTLALSQYRAVGGGDYKWFNKERMASISKIDIATLIKTALRDYDENRWKQINRDYQTVLWTPKLLLDE